MQMFSELRQYYLNDDLFTIMEPVCPLDHRYGREEMKSVMSHAARVSRCLEVEAALARAHSRFGNIPDEAAREITRKASLDFVSLERVNSIEAEIRHDIMAIVHAHSEACENDAGKYIHLGATSYDIVDTALALQMREGLDILDRGMSDLCEVLIEKAEDHRDLVMVGRTHGQFAIPITLGMKMAVWIAEITRHRQRLHQIRPRLLAGKMSGAVGTGAALGDRALEIEEWVMRELGLEVEEAATQIVQRDRMIELLSALCNISVTIEKISTEIRTLQRPEIGELQESFDSKKQVGSSTMSHKRNPIVCENITGLSRTLRGFLIPEFENGIQWNERDLSNSSSERFILPHMMILSDDIIHKMEGVIRNLVIDEERIAENLKKAGAVIMAESVIMALCEKGMGRQEAHEATRKAAMEHYGGKPYLEALLDQEGISSLLSREELEARLDPANYTGVAGKRVDDIIRRARSPQW
jgi:adenylosuccinate lyase